MAVVRWRILDLVAWLQSTFEVTLSPQTLSRELRALGYRKLSARPRHHAQAEGAIADFKKTSPQHWPFGDMPPVAGLTDADALAIAAYVRELRRANGIN